MVNVNLDPYHEDRDLNLISDDMKILIFDLLTKHTQQLEDNKQYLDRDVEYVHKHIIKINDVAYKYFNV
tara:strand:- start:1906 stop:2112 length:207 start_codon:yes stop_codon:yes gene_type:complete